MKIESTLEVIAAVIITALVFGACAYACAGPPTFNTVTVTNCIAPDAGE